MNVLSVHVPLEISSKNFWWPGCAVCWFKWCFAHVVLHWCLEWLLWMQGKWAALDYGKHICIMYANMYRCVQNLCIYKYTFWSENDDQPLSVSEPFAIVGLFCIEPVAPVCFWNNTRHSSYPFPSKAVSWYSEQDFESGIVLFVRISHREYGDVISWVVPWEMLCNNLFSFPTLGVCSLWVEWCSQSRLDDL